MKGAKALIASLGFIAASTTSAANYSYLLTGSLDAYSATGPKFGSVTGALDPISPAISGTMYLPLFSFNVYLTSDFNIAFATEYLNVELSGGATATKIYPQLQASFVHENTRNFNSATRHLSATFNSGGSHSSDTFCIGAAAVCGSLYNESTSYSGYAVADLELDFNEQLNAFTGTLVETNKLSGDVIITKTFILNGTSVAAVPLPETSFLFSGSIFMLAKIRQSRRQC